VASVAAEVGDGGAGSLPQDEALRIDVVAQDP
jgi:hypothetical protein